MFYKYFFQSVSSFEEFDPVHERYYEEDAKMLVSQ